MITLFLATIAPEATPGNNQILQLMGQFGIKPHLLLAQMVNFAIVASILYFFVIKRIQSKLDERAKTIDEGLKRAEESAQTLETAKAQRESIIAEARKEVQKIVERTQKEMMEYENNRRAQAQTEAEAIVDSAKRSLAAEHAQQIASAEKRLAELVVSVAEKSLEETLTPEQKSRFAERIATTLHS